MQELFILFSKNDIVLHTMHFKSVLLTNKELVLNNQAPDIWNEFPDQVNFSTKALL